MLKYFSKLLFLIFTAGLLLELSSCTKSESIEYKDQESLLEVSVTGTLSGNPRENITVAIYASKSDAEDQNNEVKVGQKTNSEGKTIFNGLVPGSTYWVRADALLSKKIKQTNSLNGGNNFFDIHLL